MRETIGGEYFTGPDNFLMNMTVDEVQQWNLMGSGQHPFHLHVNHMQFVNVDGPTLVPGWNHVGDWIDTVSSKWCCRHLAESSAFIYVGAVDIVLHESNKGI